MTPIVAGLAVAALTIGWPISAAQSGRLYLRIGFRPTALIGLVIAAVGALSLWLASATPNVWATAGSSFVVGLGLGLVATPTLIAAQAPCRGASAPSTGTNMFMRSVGAAVGVAIFGAVANAIIAANGGPTSVSAVQPAQRRLPRCAHHRRDHHPRRTAHARRAPRSRARRRTRRPTRPRRPKRQSRGRLTRPDGIPRLLLAEDAAGPRKETRQMPALCWGLLRPRRRP